MQHVCGWAKSLTILQFYISADALNCTQAPALALTQFNSQNLKTIGQVLICSVIWILGEEVLITTHETAKESPEEVPAPERIDSYKDSTNPIDDNKGKNIIF